MKGVSSTTRNGNTYWYARVDGQKKYMGKDDEGKELAIAARSKYVAKQYENRNKNRVSPRLVSKRNE